MSNGGIANWAAWSPLGDEIFDVNRQNQMIPESVGPRIVPVLGEPIVLFSLVDTRLQAMFDIDVAPDGKRFIVTRSALAGTRDEIIVVRISCPKCGRKRRSSA